MHIPTDYHDRIVTDNGGITRIVRAEWKDTKHGGNMYYCDVYMETDDGEFYKRNIYSCTYGYGAKAVAFPGLPMYAHGPKDELAEEEEWEQLNKMGDFGGDELTEADIEKVCLIYPNFRYVLSKFPIKQKYQLMEILIVWKVHPELEFILAAGYVKIGMNESFWKLSEAKRKEICRFMRRYPQFNELKLREIQSCIKREKPELYAEYMVEVSKEDRTKSCYSYNELIISFEDFCYLKKLKGVNKGIYKSEIKNKIQIFKDVLSMLNRSIHDINDPYWRHPKNLVAIHDRLRAEEQMEEEARQKNEFKKLEAIARRFAGTQKEIDDYCVFVSCSYDEWKRQADALYQCILRAGYYRQMAKMECVLVFITKNGEPVATAQIYEKKRIGQFYGNEKDHDNCTPDEEVKNVLKKWLDSVPESKFKKRQVKAA